MHRVKAVNKAGSGSKLYCYNRWLRRSTTRTYSNKIDEIQWKLTSTSPSSTVISSVRQDQPSIIPTMISTTFMTRTVISMARSAIYDTDK